MSFEFLVSESKEVRALAYLASLSRFFRKGRAMAMKAVVFYLGAMTQLKTQNSKLNIHPKGV